MAARGKMLVVGANGMLGRALMEACARGGDVEGADLPELDITDAAATRRFVEAARPAIVVNAAAMTDVDGCEADPGAAFAVNARGAGTLAGACRAAGARLVHVSTDYVFDGGLDRPYHEHDDTNPQSVYGRSKLAGEREALALGPSATVVRTSWVCGRNGNNMVKTVMRLAQQHPQLSFVADQVGHPTFTQDLAPVLRRLALDRLSGVVHATNQRACSWYQFAGEVVAAMGKDPSMVQPIATADLHPPRPAPRPANSVLDNAVLRAAGHSPLRDFGEPLRETVAALLAE